MERPGILFRFVVVNTVSFFYFMDWCSKSMDFFHPFFPELSLTSFVCFALFLFFCWCCRYLLAPGSVWRFHFRNLSRSIPSSCKRQHGYDVVWFMEEEIWLIKSSSSSKGCRWKGDFRSDIHFFSNMLMMATVTPHRSSTSCFLPASGDFFDPVHEST